MSENIPPSLATLAVPIETLSPWPGNARRGNVDLIADSLTAHGQIRPVVVRSGSNEVLAGNHTWQAAKRLGWSRIAAVFVEVDDDTARRIVLVDNKSSDVATYDDPALLDLLTALPTLEGTGWDENAIARLRQALDDFDISSLPVEPADDPLDGPEGDLPEQRPGPEPTHEILIGDIKVLLSERQVAPWRDTVLEKNQYDQGMIVADLRERLRLPEPPVKEATLPAKRKFTGEEMKIRRAERKARLEALKAARNGGTRLADLEVGIDEVQPYPSNARRGDTDLLAESLLANGQYKPILVNRRTMQILGGNHTWQAAKALGWEKVAATFVDVDDEEAARLVLVDNRTSDLATYDTEALIGLLEAVPDVAGTGFDDFDLDALVYEQDRAREKEDRKANPARPPVRVQVLTWKFPVAAEDYDRWLVTMKRECGDDVLAIRIGVAGLLGLDLTGGRPVKKNKKKKES